MGLDSLGPQLDVGSLCLNDERRSGALNEQCDDHLGRSISSLLGATRELNLLRGGISNKNLLAIVYWESLTLPCSVSQVSFLNTQKERMRNETRYLL